MFCNLKAEHKPHIGTGIWALYCHILKGIFSLFYETMRAQGSLQRKRDGEVLFNVK